MLAEHDAWGMPASPLGRALSKAAEEAEQNQRSADVEDALNRFKQPGR